MLLDMYFENYTTVDVIDTGVGDCRSEECRQKAEKNAEMIHCGLQYVPGSNQMLEKLLSGQWERIAEPKPIRKAGPKARTVSKAFERLLAAAERLLSICKTLEGRPNRVLEGFARDIDKLSDRLEK